MAAISEFSVQLTVTSGANSLAPDLEWFCRQDAFCSAAVPSLEGLCPPSQFTDLSQYTENLSSLAGGCNQIELLDASAMYQEPVCPESNCGGVLYRYRDGRNRMATCPVGSEIVVSAVGIPGNIEYIFSPFNGAELMGNVPFGCSFVSGAYRCEPGSVSLTFAVADEEPLPLIGFEYGSCGASQECVVPDGDPPTLPPTTDDTEFSVRLSATSGANSLAPGLEWFCQQDEFCSTVTPSLAGACPRSEFSNLSEYTENIFALVGGCNEIELLDGSALYQEPVCPDSNCGAVLYRYRDGRNKLATCPIGSTMHVNAVGIPGNIDYIFTPSTGLELIGEMSPGCLFIGGAYRCDSGSVSLSFAVTNPQNPLRLIGLEYGSCRAGYGCLTAFGKRPVLPPGNDYSVRLSVTSGANSLAPALEWFCRSRRQDTFCSYSPSILSAPGTCTDSNFADLTDYTENLASLAGGCNKVELNDGSALYGDPVCPDSSCGATLFRYRDGRNVFAYCPYGTEMVVSAVGIPGNINYILTPSDGVELVGDLPLGCVFVSDGYRCEPGTVNLRFTNFANPCAATLGSCASPCFDTIGGCAYPATGLSYGECGQNPNQDCAFGLNASQLVTP